MAGVYRAGADGVGVFPAKPGTPGSVGEHSDRVMLYCEPAFVFNTLGLNKPGS